MPSSALTELIEVHVDGLTREALQKVIMHPRTPSFRRVPRGEVIERIGAVYRSLAGWLAVHDDDAVRAAFEDWGRTRFKQNFPLSELAYAVLLAKDHLRRYAHDRGLVELQAVEAGIGEFFDRALYYLVRGYEMHAATPRPDRPAPV
ncbi:MAG TPA: hypothetical protein VGM22_17105 [Methylomirabilota bacterium]|jgi:hypothetical protein